MLRQLAPWVFMMVASTIFDNVFHLGSLFFNFWYLSICVSLYSIISNSYHSLKNSSKNEINLNGDNYDSAYIMHQLCIFFAIMFVTFVISVVIGIDFFTVHAFVFLGEIIDYNPMENNY